MDGQPRTPDHPDPRPAAPAPGAEEILERARVLLLPLRTRFRGIGVREVLLVEGPAGWAEFSAFPEYPPAEAGRWLASCVEMGWTGPPPMLRERVPVNATVPAVAPGQVPEVLARYPDCTTVKVKIAGETGLAEDVARVAAVRAAAPDAAVRCDANGAYDVAGALAAARALTADGPLDYLEQPCATVAELAEVRRRVRAAGLPLRIAADESIRRAADPWAVVRARAADAAVVKAAPLGGPRALVALAGRLADRGLTVTVSSALESAVGMYAGLAAAAALPEPVPAGLATGSLYAADVAAPREIVDGTLAAVPVTPDPDRLAALAAPAAVRDRWFSRVRECVAAGALN